MKRKAIALKPTKEPDLADSGSSSDRAIVSFNPLQHYLAEIRLYPILSREEEHLLAVEYKERASVTAAHRLITSNLKLVVMIALKHGRVFGNLLDLIQEGNVGLIDALKNYDPYRGIRFPSYAAWWIRAYIVRFIMNNWRMVKVGTTRAQRKLFFNLQKEKQKLEAEGFAPEPTLLGQRLGVKEKEVVEMEQRLSNGERSTDVPVGQGKYATLLDILSDRSENPEECVAAAQYHQVLEEKMRQFAKDLKDRELVIFRERLLADDPLTLREIGERYGITRERVRQIEERVKKKIQVNLRLECNDFKKQGLGLARG